MSGSYRRGSVDTFGGGGGGEYESEKRDAFDQESLGRMRIGSNGGQPRRRQSPSFDDDDDYEEDDRVSDLHCMTD